MGRITTLQNQVGELQKNVADRKKIIAAHVKREEEVKKLIKDYNEKYEKHEGMKEELIQKISKLFA